MGDSDIFKQQSTGYLRTRGQETLYETCARVIYTNLQLHYMRHSTIDLSEEVAELHMQINYVLVLTVVSTREDHCLSDAVSSLESGRKLAEVSCMHFSVKLGRSN